MSTAGLSLLVLIMLPPVLAGILAQLYHLNLYRVIIFIKIEIVYIMYITVVAQAMVLPVVRFVLMLTVPSAVHLGIVAPPYHLNQLFEILIKNKWALIKRPTFFFSIDNYYIGQNT